MRCPGSFVSLLTKYIASNGWKQDEGNDLKSLIMGIYLGKSENRCLFYGEKHGREVEFYN